MLVEEEGRDRGDSEPVEQAEREAPADGGEQENGRRVREPRAEKGAVDAEPRRDRVQSLLTVDLDVEERIEEVEAADPERDRAAERPGLPG